MLAEGKIMCQNRQHVVYLTSAFCIVPLHIASSGLQAADEWKLNGPLHGQSVIALPTIKSRFGLPSAKAEVQHVS